MGENTNVDWWHVGPAQETQLALASVLHADLYSENLSTYSLEYKSMKRRKGVTANIPVWNGCTQAALWHQHIRQVVRVSGGDVLVEG